MSKIKTGLHWRAAKVSNIRKDEETGATSVELSFSSESPVERYYGEIGDEILSHDSGHARMDWMTGGTAPLLMDHDPERQIGVVESASVDNKTRRGIATVRFSKREEVKGIIQDVVDGIRGNVSVGYRVNKVIQEVAESGRNIFRVTDWQPMEISLVSIPADMSVGVGRSDEFETEITVIKKEKPMTEVMKPVTTAPVVDVKGERNDAVAIERQRSADIMALGAVHKVDDLARKAVAEGSSLNEFRGVVLDKFDKEAVAPIEAPSGEVDAKPDELRQYSVFRAVEAIKTGNWDHAGFEREMSEDIAKRTGKNPQGMYVPTNIWGKRDISVGSNGELVGTDHMANDYIAALRARSVVMSAGARMLTGLVGNLSIPAANAVTQTYWVAENGEPTEGAPTYRNVTLSPKTVGAYVDITRSMQLQGSPDPEALVRDDILAGIATAIDTAALNGGGTNEPTGILQTSGIGDVAIGTNGGAISYADVLALLADVGAANALDGSLNFIGNSQVKYLQLMAKQKVGGTDSTMIMNEINTLMGYKYLETNNMPTDLVKGSLSTGTGLIFGNFNDLLIGHWGALDLTIDPYSNSTTGAVRIVGFQDVDVAVRHAESFTAIQDIDVTV